MQPILLQIYERGLVGFKTYSLKRNEDFTEYEIDLLYLCLNKT